VQATLAHHDYQRIPRGEIWLGRGVFQDLGLEDTLEAHLRLCHGPGGNAGWGDQRRNHGSNESTAIRLWRGARFPCVSSVKGVALTAIGMRGGIIFVDQPL